MKELQPLIDQLGKIVEGTRELTVAQTPDFVYQFLLKSAVEAVAWGLFFLPIMVASIAWALWINKNWGRLREEEDFFHPAGCVLLLLASSLGIIINAVNLVTIYFAPKAWIVSKLITALVP